MLGFSLPEILFLAVLALVVVGPKQLPEVARTIGRVLNELKRASSSLTDEFRDQMKIDPIRRNDRKTPVDKVAEEPTNQIIANNTEVIKTEPTAEIKAETKPDPGNSQT